MFPVLFVAFSLQFIEICSSVAHEKEQVSPFQSLDNVYEKIKAEIFSRKRSLENEDISRGFRALDKFYNNNKKNGIGKNGDLFLHFTQQDEQDVIDIMKCCEVIKEYIGRKKDAHEVLCAESDEEECCNDFGEEIDNQGDAYDKLCPNNNNSVAVLPTSEVCNVPEALGMENGKISDAQITASSEYWSKTGAIYARLNYTRNGGGWVAKENSLDQWLQVDFKDKTVITDILTQGRYFNSQWVKSYTVSYSDDGVSFKSYEKNGEDKIFTANVDSNSIVKNKLDPVIVARFVRIHPRSWNVLISMRVEFYGCVQAAE